MRRNAPNHKPVSRRRLTIEPLESRHLLSATTVNPTPVLPVESIDGSGVNVSHPTYGQAGTDLLRAAAALFGDGISTPNGADLPSARLISNVLGAQTDDIFDSNNDSDFVWAWGQFIDHDLDLTNTSDVPFDIAVPTGDTTFDPLSLGNQTLPDARSVTDPATGTSTSNPLNFPNSITAWIDGSMIYGSDPTRAAALRTMSGGHLATSANNLLPYNTQGLDNANATGAPTDDLFVSGDVRTNENIVLTSIITVFVREHNYWADKLHAANPTWTDQQLYDKARAIVIAEIQEITYTQWLPAQGINLTPYKGFQSNVNPGITAEFSEAAFRYGHSQIDGDVQFDDANGNPISFSYTIPGFGTVDVPGELPEENAFFDPYVIDNATISPNTVVSGILKYLSSDNGQAADLKMVDGIRNVLFGAPDTGAGGQDLFALDVQRGRDIGLNTLNATRQAYGLQAYTSFAQISSDPTVQAELQQLYGTVDKVELFAGGLAEDHVKGSVLGSTFSAIITDQFQRLRDGDPYFYLNQPQLAPYGVNTVTLAQIIGRNTGLTNLQSNVFLFDVSIHGQVSAASNSTSAGNKGSVGLQEITVQLLDSTNTVIATAITDKQGNYTFDGLDLGTYHVQIVLTASQTQTSPNPADLVATKGITFCNVNFIVATTTTPTKPGGDPPPKHPSGNGGGSGGHPSAVHNGPTNSHQPAHFSRFNRAFE
jgi:peroxidase